MTKKTDIEIKKLVDVALHNIVPEADLDSLNPDVLLRDELDMDSMDFFRFIIKLHKSFELDIPESDYSKLSTLKKCYEYFKMVD